MLERVGLISRTRSSGDGRRRYVQLQRDALADLVPGLRLARQPALFVCTHNSARSQLAAALWSELTEAAGGQRRHPPRRACTPAPSPPARRAGLDLSRRRPTLARRRRRAATALVVTVCDRAHEELDPEPTWLHWSIPDPVATRLAAAFDATVAELRERITALVAAA